MARTSSVIHIVVFDLREDFPEAQIRTLMEECRQNVAGLIQLEFGKEVPDLYAHKADRTRGYTHALMSQHIDGLALKAYQANPAHVKLAKLFVENSKRLPVCIDFCHSKL